MTPPKEIQEELAYIYTSAKKRIAANKEYAEEQNKILEKYNFAKSLQEAQLRLKQYNKTPFKCQIWVNLVKTEEFYDYGDKWITSDDYDILTAAEYLGFYEVPFRAFFDHPGK